MSFRFGKIFLMFFSSFSSLFSLSRTHSNVRLLILELYFLLWIFKNSILFFYVISSIFSLRLCPPPPLFFFHCVFFCFSSRFLFWGCFWFLSLLQLSEMSQVLNACAYCSVNELSDYQLSALVSRMQAWLLAFQLRRVIGSALWT